MDETSVEKRRELAAKAAAYIKQHGWVQGDYGETNGPVCAFGALNMADRGYADPGAGAGTRLVEAVGADLQKYLEASKPPGRYHYSLVDFNDAPWRNQSEVVDLFLRYARGEIPAQQ